MYRGSCKRASCSAGSFYADSATASGGHQSEHNHRKASRRDAAHTLFPRARIRVDAHANAVLVIASPDDVQQMRTVIQGIDVRNPQTPTTEVLPLHVLRPQAIIPRLRRIYPGAHIEAASPTTLVIRATPQDMAEIKSLLSSLDVAPPTAAPTMKPEDALRVMQANPRKLGNPDVQVGATLAPPQWTDVRGSSFDALDRVLSSYENAFGATPKIVNTYDTNGNYGLLSQTQNAAGQQTILSYDATAHIYQKEYQGDGGVTPWLTYTYDPDERTTGISSSKYSAAENYTYDADGRLLSVAEPQGGGYTFPATISYGYYADGQRMSLSVSSSGFSQSNLFQYAYRADSSLEKQQVNGTNAGAFSWTYTNAGRQLTQRDPYTGNSITMWDANGVTGYTRTLQPKTYTYDQYGRVSQLLLPEGYTYAAVTYDAEGELTGYARNDAWCLANNKGYNGGCTPNITNKYTVRGELTQYLEDTNTGYGSGRLANGTLVQDGSAYSTSGSSDSSKLTRFDARTGMALGMEDVGTYKVGYTDNQLIGDLTYNHDAAGRQTSITGSFTFMSGSWSATVTRAYDAENHIVSQSYNGNFACPGPLAMCGANPNMTNGYPNIASGVNLQYGWGPDGHLLTFAEESFHWDGSDVLFSSTATCCDVGIAIGKLAATSSRSGMGMTVADRDLSGQVVATHMAQDFSAWSDGSPIQQVDVPRSGDNSGNSLEGASNSDYTNYSPIEPPLGYTRTDGYSDDFGNTFQGVRAYDQNTAQWTTPDAYAGDVGDPMSQKPYMWNNNNPVSYQDPTGYEAACVSLNQACLSPEATQQIGEGLLHLYNFVIGNDLSTLRNPHASGVAKVIAGFSIGLNFLGGEGAEAKGLKGLWDAGVREIGLAEHGISQFGKDAAHSFPAVFDKDILLHGETIVGSDGYVTQRIAGSLNGHAGWYEIGGKLEDGKWKIDHRSFTEKDRSKS